MKQITEDYCNKEVSALLKEKGFDVHVKNYFSLNKDAMLHNLDKKYGAKKNWNHFEHCISRPSQSLALKWLREVHNLHITIKPYITEEGIMYLFEIYKLEEEKFTLIKTKTGFEKSELSNEAALLYVLKNLI